MTAPTAASPGAPAHTGSNATRYLGLVVAGGMALLVALALVISPSSVEQGDAVRIMYVHVPSATTMYYGFGLCGFASAMYLWKRTEFWDLLAGAAAEVGLVFCGLALATGAIWGRPTWGSYWQWDARLTSTLLLFVLFTGYLAVRALQMDTAVRAKRAAYVALFAMIDLPIVHYSVDWWRSLHQEPTLARADPTIDGMLLFTLMTGMVVFTLLFVWLVMHRFRVEFLARRHETQGLAQAIEARRAEGAEPRARSLDLIAAEASTAGSSTEGLEATT